MTLPQFTVRRLMVAVAIMALGLGVLVELLRRRASYNQGATYHAAKEAQFKQLDETLESIRSNLSAYARAMRRVSNREESRTARLVRYHATLKGKYRSAASRPWLPVEPDPPAPE